MHRRFHGAIALSFVLAASAAAAGPADAATPLDTTFGDGGFAFSVFDEDTAVASSRTIAGRNGELVTAALTSRSGGRDERAMRAGEPDQGLTVTRRSAAGAVLSTAFFERINGRIPGTIFDMRLLEDGSVVVVGRGAFNDGFDYPHAWFARVDAAGAAVDDGSTESRDSTACGEIPGEGWRPSGDVVDGGVLPSGEVVYAWRCLAGGGLLEVASTGAAEVRGTPQPRLDWTVDMLDVDAEGRVVYHAEGGVGRLLRSGKGFVADGSFADGELMPSPIYAEFLETDAASRPVLAGSGAPRRADAQALEFARLEADGSDADASFGEGGVVEYRDERARRLESLSTDAANRVLFTTLINGSQKDRGLGRLLEDGTPDAAFGDGGLQVLDQDRMIIGTAPLLGAGDAVYATLNFGRWDESARTTVPAPAGVAAVGIARFAAPPKPVVEQPRDEQQQQPQPQPQPQPQTQVATSTTAASTAPRTARMCLSRRSFTIRLRPRTLKTATVKVAGKKVETTRRNGRLTAKVDLRKFKQASFQVVVTGRTAKGRSIRETRTYRTCRVGENGPKVKGGSITITLGA
jgi:hypothetical protein